jgi:hypothetical protein
MENSDFKLADFEKLFPEITKPAVFLSDIKSYIRLRSYPKDEFASCLNDFYFKKDKHEGYKKKPEGYLFRVVSNANIQWQKSRNKVDMDIELPDNSDNPEFGEIKDSIQKIVDFSERVRSDNFLSKKELQLFEIIVETSNEEHNKYSVFWDEVCDKAFRAGFKDDNIRQTLSRLRNNFKPGERGNDLKDMLHHLPANKEREDSIYLNIINEMELRLYNLGKEYNENDYDNDKKSDEQIVYDEIIKQLQEFFNEDNKLNAEDILNKIATSLNLTTYSMTNLKAYRFSDEELEKMKWLKKLFEQNSFSFDPNRFPQVYYDTFDNACEVYPSIKKRNDDEKTADALAHYIPDYTNYECQDNCQYKVVNEGVIILYEDRIFNYAEEIAKKLIIGVTLVEKALKEVVLYHELGHWLTHWPLDKLGLNWKCRYYYNYETKVPDKIIHESFAQLIAYWCANGNPINETILKDHLTPNDQDSPYYMYLNLTGKSVEEILNKLVIIRKYMGCNPKLVDKTAYEFLEMDTSIDQLVAFANTSIRRVCLDKVELEKLRPETILEIFIFGKLNDLEYDYALCLMDKKGLLDEMSKDALKFDNRLCVN